ncbi:hypothetical protein AS030_17740 [Fictibacillus enclensis]|uniref:Uncharacterized protein n=1 Tax=Fictibacillus enclensis TaxID=1017270 RepID=A0A0V8J4N2_9BACL|nr:hypothetical protein AS030_17740 [Fictibacillus enclensis]
MSAIEKRILLSLFYLLLCKYNRKCLDILLKISFCKKKEKLKRDQDSIQSLYANIKSILATVAVFFLLFTFKNET